MKQLSIESKRYNFKNWCIENKKYILFIIAIYQFGVLSIGIVNFPYIDDNARQVAGMTDFGTTYARWVSEFLSWFVQGSRHLTDMGLTTHILTGFILSLTSILAIYIVTDKKITWYSAISSTLIGLNPWFLQCISFRFDSPYMAISILFSFIPFYWWHNRNSNFLILSVISLFCMFNTYQASSGIYIVIVLLLSLNNLLNGCNSTSILKKIGVAAASFLIATFIYLVELKLVPSATNNIGGSSSIPSLRNIPNTAFNNIGHYFFELFYQSNRLWILLVLVLLFLFLISSVFNSKINYATSLLLCVIYLVFSSILSFGIFIVYSKSIAGEAPRYIYGFAVFISLSLISLTSKTKVKSIYFTSVIITSLFSYYVLSFSLVYAATLNYQKEAFSNQANVLITDLKDVVNSKRKKVFFNTFFKNSPIYYNNLANYPIIANVVPPNDGLYWPNQVRFNTFSNLGIEITPIDSNNSDMSKNRIEVSNYYYDIYTNETEIFVFMK